MTEDEYLDAVVDGNAYVHQKLAAMRAHATQITVDGPVLRAVEQHRQRGVGDGVLPARPRAEGAR